MDVIHTTRKDRLLDTIERFYIYNETRRNNQINDKCTAKPNVVFETVILEDTDRAHFTSKQLALSQVPRSRVPSAR